MTQSSFYADGGTYDTATVTPNDVPGASSPSQAPSGFYPEGTLYDYLSSESAVLAQLEDLGATTTTNAASASTSATNAATSATNAAAAATTAVAGAAGTVTPIVDGTATVGTSAKWAHEDHAHPTDTSRASVTALGLKADTTYVDTQDAAGKSYTDTQVALKAPLASPALTGAPTAPTASVGTNTTQLATTAFVLANSGGTPPGKNKLINGGFRVNQRGYVSASTLAAGSYGHDRWKAGASGGDYSFTQLANSTTITIATGKSLIQVVEDKNVEGGSYVLSWSGTATARAGVNSATPSGSFVSSPLTISGQTAGTVMSVEFGPGTLGKVQLETGSTATAFEQRLYGTELYLCQRYCYVISPGASGAAIAAGGVSGTTGYFPIMFPQKMLFSPTMSMAASDWNVNPFVSGGSIQTGTSVVFGATSAAGTRVQLTSASTGAPSGAMADLETANASAKITAVAEL